MKRHLGALAMYREGMERTRSAALRMQSTIDALPGRRPGPARTIDRRSADLAAIARNVTNQAQATATMASSVRSAIVRRDA